MLEIHRSDAAEQNPDFKEIKRKKGETNAAWLKRNWGDDRSCTRLLLIGGTSGVAARLRFAQSDARSDLTPSNWSHLALVTGRSALREIALEPASGFGHPPATNGVQEGRMSAYNDAKLYPNLALIRLPVSPRKVMAACRRFETQRNALDSVELTLRWLSFAWGAGASPNPLLDGYGMPSAAMVEFVVNAAGYELTPGLASRSSCPEAVWQSARWWHDYYADGSLGTPVGTWNVEQYYVD